ncbi:MAG: phage tail protein [Pseudomonadota bacterium]
MKGFRQVAQPSSQSCSAFTICVDSRKFEKFFCGSVIAELLLARVFSYQDRRERMGDWFIGEIRLFPMGWNPSGWLPCDGSILNINGNAALYSLLGTAFGGNGTTTFGLPDLRGRTIMGTSNSDSSYYRGVAGGAETVQLTEGQVPAHVHGVTATTAVGSFPVPDGAMFATSATEQIYASFGSQNTAIPLNPLSLDATGGGQAHPNMQPFQVLNFCIANSGIYPPRN